MNTITFNNIATNLSTETGVDFESASKVVTWLINEGVLDIPVANETFAEGDGGTQA